MRHCREKSGMKASCENGSFYAMQGKIGQAGMLEQRMGQVITPSGGAIRAEPYCGYRRKTDVQIGSTINNIQVDQEAFVEHARDRIVYQLLVAPFRSYA